jgi:rfaE bifunctional protein kinase chain/domain
MPRRLTEIPKKVDIANAPKAQESACRANAAGLTACVARFNAQKLMIIGDIIADVYLEGKISRISREAPVLILEHAGETIVPGGAANVINNTATLGGTVYAIGVVGADQPGGAITGLLQAKTINTEGLYHDPARPTITKTRIIAGGIAAITQQIVRIDREAKGPIAPAAEEYLLARIQAQIQQVNAVILSDYGYQCITPTIRERTIAWCRSYGIPCIVDSRYAIRSFKGITIAKQNELELAAVVGYPLVDEPTLLRAGRELLDFLEAEAVMVTRGPDGITLIERDDTVTQIPVTNASEVFDVSGAGDTVVAGMMLALAAGASRIDAARLANYAAGVVVRKLGTATVSQAELIQAIGGDI